MIKRYRIDSRINLGQQLGTARGLPLLRREIKSGRISIINQVITTGDDRLDSLAGSIYGDGRYWWVLAAASDIGWGLQVPPGTVINIVNLEDVQNIIG